MHFFSDRRLSRVYPRIRTSLLVIFVHALILILPATAQQADSLDRDYSSELPRFPALSPEQAIDAFEILEGFKIELVASEPLVVDPIAFAFDARSRLFVVEMRGYSEQPDENLGRIALLEDSDGDGKMDKRTTFAEGLSWPTALWPWRDGVLVAAPPRLTWYRDTDGDGVSDNSEVWFEGFGKSNVQGMTNSLRWGVDGFLHGATSSTGAELTSASANTSNNLTLRRTDYAIDPLHKSIAPTGGGGQHGLSFNRWGDKFVTSNSDHLQQVLDLESWLQDHPSRIALPSLRKSIAQDGPQAEVFRISPVEPWRVVRTRLRVGGLVSGPIEGGGRAAGYFTGATGTWIVDQEAGFSTNSQDAALVCDVGSNLVHRKTMRDLGLFWTSDRADPATELLRSRDTWFRPVQLGDGPDGAVYVADMYREVIEHPKSLPTIIKKHLDLTSGRNRGRIWRLTPSRTPFEDISQVDLSKSSESELLELLGSPIAWRRRMASQLLIERGIKSAEAVQSRILDDKQPQAQVLALHAAHRCGQLDMATVVSVLSSTHPRVRQHALQLIRQNGWWNNCFDAIRTLAQQDSLEDRLLLEISLLAPELDAQQLRAILPPLLARSKEPILQAILGISLEDSPLKPEQLLAIIPRDQLSDWLQNLLSTWSRQALEHADVATWLASQLADTQQPQYGDWMDAWTTLAAAERNELVSLVPDHQFEALQEYVLARVERDPGKSKWLLLLSASAQQKWIEAALAPASPNQVQKAAIELLDATQHPATGDILTSRLGILTPELQALAMRVLASRPQWTLDLLQAIEAKKVASNLIPTDLATRLKSSKDGKIAGLAESLLGKTSVDRAAVIARYSPALDAKPVDTAVNLGKAHFAKVCAQCHQIGDLGNNVGAALKQLGDKTPKQLLEAILDPNREVDPRYVGYAVLTTEGRTLAGIIEAESAHQITLREAGGKQTRITREDIEQIKNQGISLMPEGLEDQLSPTQMAELIQFLRANHP